jgi:putative heme-binding domain-containing protein
MRYRKFEEAREVLVNVAKGYDGKDRSYLEILGVGTGHHTAALWQALVEAMKPGEPSAWSDTFARLTWRLKPEAAIPALQARALDDRLHADQRKFAVDSIAFIKSRNAANALMEIAAQAPTLNEQVKWWLTHRSDGEWAEYNLKPELEKRGIIEKSVPLVEVTVPAKPDRLKFSVADVLALKGDATKGKLAAGRCIMCHKIDDAGPDYGPEIKGFGSRQPPEVIAKSLIDPSADIAHGYEGTAIQLKDGKWIDGQIIADGDPIVIRSTGGFTQKIPKKQVAGRKTLDRSLMLGADQLGLGAQDVADIIEWMKTY